MLAVVVVRAPSASVRFVIFLCGSSPMWLMRLWPLISRGWKTWTKEPPSLPGVLYGWAFPKLM